jgi:hypothetical protein
LGNPSSEASPINDAVAPIPWRLLMLIGAIYVFTASGRVANVDAGTMLALTRSILSGHLTIPPEVAGMTGADGGHYCHFGLFTSLYWAPFVLAGRLAAGFTTVLPAEFLEEFFVSFSSIPVVLGILAYLARFWIDAGASRSRVRTGLWLAAFATMLWPYSKIVMSDQWMALQVLAGIYHWKRGLRQREAVIAGLWLGLAIITRKQAQMVVPTLLLLLWWEAGRGSDRWRRLLLVGLGMLPGLLIQAAYNQARFGSPIVERYSGVENPALVTPLSAGWPGLAWGFLASEEHGFVVYQLWPCVVLALAGKTWLRVNRRGLFGVIVLNVTSLLFLSVLPLSFGGVSFGARLMLFGGPLLLLGWPYVPDSLGPMRRSALRLAVVVSVFIAALGVLVDANAVHLRWMLVEHEHGSTLVANVREVGRVFGLPQPPLPPEVAASPYATHPPFQVPDFWWIHAARVLAARHRPP